MQNDCVFSRRLLLVILKYQVWAVLPSEGSPEFAVRCTSVAISEIELKGPDAAEAGRDI
jgi:hypothetical protein